MAFFVSESCARNSGGAVMCVRLTPPNWKRLAAVVGMRRIEGRDLRRDLGAERAILLVCRTTVPQRNGAALHR